MAYEQCREAIENSTILGDDATDVIEVVLFFDEAQYLAADDGYLLNVCFEGFCVSFQL